MYKVIQAFYDAETLELYLPETVVPFTDEKRIKNALKRGLIVEVKEEKKEEPKSKKTPAKKKAK